VNKQQKINGQCGIDFAFLEMGSMIIIAKKQGKQKTKIEQ
jgi:hypothetical protein